MRIELAAEEDQEEIWSVIEPVLRAGETYTLPRDISKEAALRYWMADDRRTFVADEGNEGIVGTYYLRSNQTGAGSHVANCGYITRVDAFGRGIAREMCRHSLVCARELGYRAMQFNLVVRSNSRAVRLWQSLGFDIVGVLPGVFDHPSQGYVDGFVMFQSLIDKDLP